MSEVFHLVDETAQERFDTFVRRQRGHPGQAFGASDPESQRGWHPIYAMLEEEGRILATMAALRKPIPTGGRLCFMDVANGPVADFSSVETTRRVIRAAVQFARVQGAIHLRLDPFVESSEALARVFAECGFLPARNRRRSRAAFRVTLARPLDQIFASMERETRRHIRRVEERGIEVSTCYSERDIADFLALYRQMCSRQGFIGRSPEYLRALCAKRRHTQLFVARVDGVAVQALLAYAFGSLVVANLAGSCRPCPRGAGKYLYWSVMRWAHERGFAEFDLGGIPFNTDPQGAAYGVYIFKRALGGHRFETDTECERFIVPALTGPVACLLEKAEQLRSLCSSLRLSSELRMEARG